MSIDTFPTTEWGSLQETLLEISAKAGLPVKKGMRGTARLIAARRSLWQLLYQNAHEWLAPSAPPTFSTNLFPARFVEQQGVRRR